MEMPEWLKRLIGGAQPALADAVPSSSGVSASPSVSFRSVTFSDNTTLELKANDILVLVGPNNAGKSRALRDLRSLLVGDVRTAVIKSAEISRSGSLDELIDFINTYAYRGASHVGLKYYGEGFEIHDFELSNRWNGDLRDLASLFSRLIKTETRITDSNGQNAIAPFTEPPNHPIHHLTLDSELEIRLSGFFKSAFGVDLTLFRAGGSKSSLLVGDRPYLQGSEDRLSGSFLNRLRNQTVDMAQQGDGMRSFASVLLFLLASKTQTVFLLDEPEAFLHPPQARLLGELIATERNRSSQLFVATHSADILSGLLSAAPDRLRIVRIRRDGNGNNRATELDPDIAKSISTDPIMKFSNVLGGLFHQRVFICESDSDCLFYSSVLDLPEIKEKSHPDVLFVQTGGKDRMAYLANLLTALAVSVDVIVDIDVLASLGTFEKLVNSLGGNWSELAPLVKKVEAAVRQGHAWLTAPQIAAEIRSVAESAPTTGPFPANLKSQVEAVLRKTSPWAALKAAGAAAIPNGEASEAFSEIVQVCKEFGLWIVTVGELEGFCRSQGGHGPSWVQGALSRYNLGTAVELAQAREFIREIWQREVN